MPPIPKQQIRFNSPKESFGLVPAGWAVSAIATICFFISFGTETAVGRESERMHNIGLLSQREVAVTASGFGILAGLGLVMIGEIRKRG